MNAANDHATTPSRRWPAAGFVRIHRRFLVNRERIAAITGANGDRVVKLVDGSELAIGRAFAANLSRLA